MTTFKILKFTILVNHNPYNYSVMCLLLQRILVSVVTVEQQTHVHRRKVRITNFMTINTFT